MVEFNKNNFVPGSRLPVSIVDRNPSHGAKTTLVSSLMRAVWFEELFAPPVPFGHRRPINEWKKG
jgi:hypothetical protein